MQQTIIHEINKSVSKGNCYNYSKGIFGLILYICCLCRCRKSNQIATSVTVVEMTE